MAFKFVVVPRTEAQLNQMSKPASANQPEAIPFTFFDQEDFATTWTTVNFFQTLQSDPTKGNIQAAGTLSSDQWFQLYGIALDWIISATSQSSSGAPTIIDDILAIMNGARGKFVMQMAMKTYIDTPFHCFHASGGVNVQYFLGTPTGSALGNYAQNWYPDGGYNIGGSMVLPPRQVFSFQAQGASQALVATRSGRVTFFGTLYRKVA